MNKKELIERIEGLNKLYGDNKNYVSYDDVLNLVEQLYEQQKPVVKQFVADWYESNKGNLDYNLWNYIMDWDCTKEDDFKKWLNSSREAFQTIINMHQFGYKVEEEKKYLVKFKNIVKDSSCLKYDCVVGKWYFGMESASTAIRLYHTKEELEAGGFNEVFYDSMFEMVEVKE